MQSQRATEFSEKWVLDRLRNLAAEMVGIRPPSSNWLAGRVRGSGLTPQTLEYAKKMIPTTDANAARLIDDALDGRLTYVGGEWHFFDGVCHRPLPGVPVSFWAVMAFAEEFSNAMNWVHNEIETQSVVMATTGNQTAVQAKKSLRKEWEAHIYQDRDVRENSGINALKSVLTQVCTKQDDYFDNDHQWLVCQNGVLDLDEFRKNPGNPQLAFGPLDQRLPVSRAVECDFNQDADAPAWDAFLQSSVPDPEIRRFLQRLAGAALLGESKVKAIPNLKGEPDSGKSVFVGALASVFGGYSVAPGGLAIQESRGDTNFEQDELRGKRFICITEPSEDRKLDDSFVKGFTGGDLVKSRTLHKRGGSWIPQGIIFVASNHVLKLNTRDRAILDRLCLIEFPHRFWHKYELERQGVPVEQWHLKDPHLETNLNSEEERQGILMWAIRGAEMFLRDGIHKPEPVAVSGEKYAVESSRALSWVMEKIEDGQLYETETVADHPLRSYVLLGKLYQTYVSDVTMDNERPLGKMAFSRDLQQRYGELAKAGGVRVARLVGRNSLSWLDGKEVGNGL